MNEDNNNPINSTTEPVATSPDMSRQDGMNEDAGLDMSGLVATEVNSNENNQSRHVEKSHDKARFTLSVKDAANMFAEAGVPRSPRAITRYCKQGEIEFVPVDTERNSKWLLDRVSVERRIEQLRQSKAVAETDDIDVPVHVATKQNDDVGMSRLVQTGTKNSVATSRDMSRQDESVATRETPTHVKVVYLDERERELLERMLADRDAQIKSLSTDKEELRDQVRAEREMRQREQEMHMEQVKLLAASDRETKGVTKTIANLINNIWPGTKGAGNGEQPIALTPVIHDVQDNLDAEGER